MTDHMKKFINHLMDANFGPEKIIECVNIAQRLETTIKRHHDNVEERLMAVDIVRDIFSEIAGSLADYLTEAIKEDEDEGLQ